MFFGLYKCQQTTQASFMYFLCVDFKDRVPESQFCRLQKSKTIHLIAM